MDWDSRYSVEGYLFGRAATPFIARHGGALSPGSRVLAIADGEGRNSVWLAQAGHTVTAFDISPNALAKAEALASEEGVQLDLHESSVEDWAWQPGAFDAVAAIFFQFLAPPKRAEVFALIDRTLRPGGVLLLHGFAPRQVRYGTGGPPAVANMYTLDMLLAAFPGYDVIHGADYDEVISSGQGHNGKAGLVDFVARKPWAGA